MGNYTQYPVINHNGNKYEKECIGNSLVVQWLGLHASTAGSLVGELRSCMLCGAAKKKNKNVCVCVTESLCCAAEINTTL